MKKKEWHPNFLKYMKKIIEHPNYKGLSIKQKENGEYSWIATKNDIIGKKRVEWAKLKASNRDGNTDSKEIEIRVDPAIKVDFDWQREGSDIAPVKLKMNNLIV